MIGFYILLVLGLIIFLFINIYCFSFGIFTTVAATIVAELIFLWVCLGPQLTLYYILKLKTSINSYEYLYQVYESTKKEVDDLHLKNVLDKKEYDNKVKDLESIPYNIIEKQKEMIKELTKQRDRYKEEYINLKRNFLEKNDRRDGKNF